MCPLLKILFYEENNENKSLIMICRVLHGSYVSL